MSDSTSLTKEGNNGEDAALGLEAATSAEGYTDDTYMLTLSLLSRLAMLAATSKWLELTGHEVTPK